jgi:hypothetical protein
VQFAFTPALKHMLPLCRFVELFQATVGAGMAAGAAAGAGDEPGQCNTMKLHRFSHVTSVLRRLGMLRHLSSQAFEHQHVVLKRQFKRTARRTVFMAELVHALSSYQLADADQTALHRAQQGTKRMLKTAYSKVASTGQPQLVATGLSVQWSALSAGGGVEALPPEVANLPAALRVFAAVAGIDLSCGYNHSVTVVPTAIICAAVGGMCLCCCCS